MRKTTAAAIGLAIALSGSVMATASPVAAQGDSADTSTTDEQAGQDPSPEPQPVTDPTPMAIGTGTLEAPRDITVTMTDSLRFDPDVFVVAAGETVRFVLDNPTAAAHEFVIGDAEEQEHHAMEMANGMMHDEAGSDATSPDEGAMPAEDAMHHEEGAAEPNEVYLEPGASGEMVWTFDEPGEMLVGCHVPGHWEAGMRATIEVILPAST